MIRTVTRRRKPRSVAPAAQAPGDRPRLTLIAPGASPEEAAAVVAALERFVYDTAPPAPPPARGSGRWLRAALLEGISRGDRRRGAWGDPHP